MYHYKIYVLEALCFHPLKPPHKHFLFQRIYSETPSMTSQKPLPTNTLGLVGKTEEARTIPIWFDREDASCENHLKVQLNGHLNQQLQPLYLMKVDRSRQNKLLEEGALQWYPEPSEVLEMSSQDLAMPLNTQVDHIACMIRNKTLERAFQQGDCICEAWM